MTEEQKSMTSNNDNGLSNDEKNWGMYCHLAALLGFILPAIGNFLGPGLVWAIKKNDYPFVNDQGKEVLNFQITLLLISIVAGFLAAVLIGVVILWLLPFYWLIFTIVAAVRASNGEYYRYPLTLRLIK